MIVANDADRRRLLAYGDGAGLSAQRHVEAWDEWWRAWGPRIAKEVGRERWILFILDAQERLIQTEGTVGRILRNKPSWGTRMATDEEWLNINDTVQRNLAWFDRNAPKIEHVPEWAAFLLTAMRSHYVTMRRLGEELRACQEQGYNTVVIERHDNQLNVKQGAEAFLGELE